MIKYFRLLDDVHVPGRWHLGELFDQSNTVPLNLKIGERWPEGVLPQVEITHSGVVLDFFLTSFAWPIANTKLAEAIAHFAGKDLQRVPVAIPGYQGFEILNSVRIIKCLDEQHSEFMKWTKEDHRADLAGQYRMVTRLKIEAVKLPADAQFFRIEGWRIALIVSEQIKDTMEAHGCKGATFQDVT